MHPCSHNASTDTTEYWNGFYAGCEIREPSPFAEHVAKRWLKDGMTVVDAGCGCGHDSVYFDRQADGLTLIPIDQSMKAIERISRRQWRNTVDPICSTVMDFPSVVADHLASDSVDLIYARFFLHAINPVEQYTFLMWAQSLLKKGGILAMEMRTTADPLFGKGDLVSANAFLQDGHYRRFADPADWLRWCNSANVKLCEFHTSDGLSDPPAAVKEQAKPFLLRVVVEKE